MMNKIFLDTAFIQAILKLFESRQDKQWGLIDCISFSVMDEHNLKDALTSDRHFIQAGFNALLLN
ncbi:hypothetical protein [Cyanobacterium sp. IPPAS B-1200]|uniref:hypothetical protein n=1 Tax=Cyanobacterium sp. IPPAS B-1200 TaxID=1562720 RepID=UPI0019124936|nr:hypothetical protein [Cyanobacterium sp. IPPAS B-1200]